MKKFEKQKNEIDGIVCVTHYYNQDESAELAIVSATYVDYNHKNGNKIKDFFFHEVDGKSNFKKNKKDLELFLDKVYKFAEKNHFIVVFGGHMPLRYCTKKGCDCNGPVMKVVTKKEFESNPEDFLPVGSELLPLDVVFIASFEKKGELVGITAAHVNFDDRMTKKKEVLLFTKNQSVVKKDKIIESFLERWSTYALKNQCQFMELDPEEVSENHKIKPKTLTIDEFLKANSETTALNNVEDEDFLDPNASGVVTITPYFQNGKMKIISIVYIDFRVGDGTVVTSSNLLWVDYSKKDMQKRIDLFLNKADTIAEENGAAVVMLDAEELQLCKDEDCNCGEPKLSFVSKLGYLEMVGKPIPVPQQNKDGKWLN